MTGSNIPHRISEIQEIFSGIKENISMQRRNGVRKNSMLLEICTPGSCGYTGCSESARNRESELQARIGELELEMKSRVHESLTEDAEELCIRNRRLSLEIEELRKSAEEARERAEELRAMRREVARIASMNDILKRDNTEMEAMIDGYKQDIERLRRIEEEGVLQRGMVLRLKNEVMDLKGAIRIFCRIKPNINGRFAAPMTSSDDFLEVVEHGKRHEFVFDRVFGALATQSCVYSEMSMVVESVLDGYRVCVFAYGQTGSGKTHTMEGTDCNHGIITRAVSGIFRLAGEMEESGWRFETACTYVEIYNEEIVDLFAEDAKKIAVVHDGENTALTNCTVLSIENAEQALRCFQEAAGKRRTGGTESNARSSRSHAVYTLKIRMSNDVLGQRKEGVVSLIDLAGSERLNVSKAEGVRLKETQNINRSLSALGDVFNAILRRDSYVPFRNSKLTYLLQNYLSKNSRTIMLVNVSSEASHVSETVCSLRFADKVSQCKLGPVRRQVSSTVQ